VNHTTGWDTAWQQAFDAAAPAGAVPARVVREDRGVATLLAGDAVYLGEVSGRFRHDHPDPADFPVTGDWVAAVPRPEEGRATIHAVLPRRGTFGRAAAGGRGRRARCSVYWCLAVRVP
jgi:ribosome biogenesis GTPase